MYMYIHTYISVTLDLFTFREVRYRALRKKDKQYYDVSIP